MIGAEDSYYTYEYGDFFKILPAIYNWGADSNRIKDGRKVADGFVYASNTNVEWMPIEMLREWIVVNRNKMITA